MMIYIDNGLKIKNIQKSDYRFLYDLLDERDNIVNISHKKMPTYKQHLKFVDSKPYLKWYVIYYRNNRIGSAYISKQNEIGIHFKKSFNIHKLHKSVMDILIKKNPKKRYLVNVSPKNKKDIIFLHTYGFKLIQYTYELTNSKKVM